MSDFTIEMYQMCKSIDGAITVRIGGYTQRGLFQERLWSTCTCPAYKSAKHGKTNFGGTMRPNPCEHIIQAGKEVCGWHALYSMDDAQDAEQKKNMICPSCEGDTTWVRVAV